MQYSQICCILHTHVETIAGGLPQLRFETFPIRDVVLCLLEYGDSGVIGQYGIYVETVTYNNFFIYIYVGFNFFNIYVRRDVLKLILRGFVIGLAAPWNVCDMLFETLVVGRSG